MKELEQFPAKHNLVYCPWRNNHLPDGGSVLTGSVTFHYIYNRLVSEVDCHVLGEVEILSKIKGAVFKFLI